MFSLLKIKVSGFRMLKDNFTFDFLSKARVSFEDNTDEIIKIDNNLYTYNIIALTGSNASGKSTTLDLIKNVLILMETGRWSYNPNDFSSTSIKLHIEFYLDGIIYLYDANIMPINEITGQILSPFCRITNEITKSTRYDSKVGKHYISELTFIDYLNQTGIEDTSNLIFICKGKSNIFYIPEFSKNGILVNNLFFDSLNFLDKKLTQEIIRLLDDTIEYIHFDGSDDISFKRLNEEERIINKKELLSLLSNGTIKGIDLYIKIILLLKNGGIMLIDEIENCFHKNLVNNLLFLITDKTININHAQIIFSTHYVEILDIFERRDNIFILHKINNKIELNNLYADYDYRTEILKSKKFNNNTFNTLLNYDQLMKVNNLLKKEIYNSKK